MFLHLNKPQCETSVLNMAICLQYEFVFLLEHYERRFHDHGSVIWQLMNKGTRFSSFILFCDDRYRSRSCMDDQRAKMYYKFFGKQICS